MNISLSLLANGRVARITLLSFSALAAWLLFGPTIAAEGAEAEGLNQLQMGMGLFGGLALFLFGMEQMGDGLKAAAGERMKDILARLTRTRIHAAITGAIVTAVIQSSSVTTVLVVGFVSAGLMTLTQSVGIIMGANIGTTVTAQIVAFKVEEAALLMIAVGFAMNFLTKQGALKHYGAILMGLRGYSGTVYLFQTLWRIKYCVPGIADFETDTFNKTFSKCQGARPLLSHTNMLLHAYCSTENSALPAAIFTAKPDMNDKFK